MKNEKLTKIELVNNISERLSGSIKKNAIKELVDIFLDEIKESLKNNKIVEFRGFGTFEVKSRKERRNARNPRTGKLVNVESHSVVLFKPGKELKSSVWGLKY